MLRTRMIPVLLLQNGGLVKGTQFKDHKYIGDPINAVKIFNEKEVDELILIDISATKENREPDYQAISDIANEAFMPIGYGGGISKIEQIEKIISLGVEKVIINSAAFQTPSLITDAVKHPGRQSIVVSIDVKRALIGGYHVAISNGRIKTREKPIEYAKKMEGLGAGELILCSIDREGTAQGYDLKLLDAVSKAVDIPVVGLGGAGCLQDLADAKNQTAVSGLAAGDFFVFHGKHKAVLITYPKYSDFEMLLQKGN